MAIFDGGWEVNLSFTTKIPKYWSKIRQSIQKKKNQGKNFMCLLYVLGYCEQFQGWWSLDNKQHFFCSPKNTTSTSPKSFKKEVTVFTKLLGQSQHNKFIIQSLNLYYFVTVFNCIINLWYASKKTNNCECEKSVVSRMS